jgi:hypothetical protein
MLANNNIKVFFIPGEEMNEYPHIMGSERNVYDR